MEITMEFKPKNREWVKNAAIVFLAVLLVLTFFSNTIMNRTLPEVATAAVTDGSIVAKVRGSGTVKANGNHDVKATQTREIRSVMVKVGQEVKTGDPLFVLGAGDSAELEAAKESLRDLQYSYQKAAVNMPTFNNTAEYRALETADRNLEAADKAYRDAETAYNVMKENLSDKETLDKLEDAEKAMKEAYNALISVQASYDEAYQKLNAKVVDWQNRVNELRDQTPITTPEPTPIPTTPPEEDKKEGLNDGTLDNTLNDTTDNTGSNTTDEPRTEQQQEENPSAVQAEAVSAGESSSGFVLLGRLRPTGGYVRLAELQGSYQPGEKTPNDVKSLAEAEQWLAAAQAELAAFAANNSATLKNARSAYDTAKAKYDALLKYNEQVNYQLVPYKEALDNADTALTTAENAYNDALANLNYTQASNDKTLTSASIDLQQLAEKIKLAQEKVKELSGDAGDQIVANVNGTVTAIGCSAGDTVTKDTVVCSIEVPDMGHTLSFSVTNDQAQRLRVGDTATVSNYYWGKEIVATLTTIRTDPKNPQTNKELTFDLSGDVTSGSELTISVGQKSANYDVIIPNSAIRSDNNGKFVLAIQAKSSPLGNRYIAKRVSVEVLAADDNNSAVVADLGYGDYVITTSSSPVKSGDQVRMAESNG